MRIFINLSIIQNGGGLQVAHSFVHELRHFREHQYYIALSPKIKRLFRDDTFPTNFIFGTIDPSPSKIIAGYPSRKLIKKMERDFRPDVVFTLFGPPYWKPKTVHVCGYALAQHIYLDSPYFDRLTIKNRIILYFKGKIKLYSFRNHCSFWITETTDVALRLSAKLNVNRGTVFTVSNTYNGIFDNPALWKQGASSLRLNSGFKLITISSFYPHKNLEIIPLVTEYLISVYPDFDFTFVITVEASLFLNLTIYQKKHICFLGSVDIEECPLLYKESDALFMPTLLECFTASYVEAMKMGIPILTSNISFAHDICQNAAIYFNPLDVADIANKIVALAKDRALREEIVKNGKIRLKDFGTARDRTECYLNVLQKIVSNSNT